MSAEMDEILQQQDDGTVDTTPEAAEIVSDESIVEEASTTDEVLPQVEEAQPEPIVPPPDNEVNELRQFIREQRKELAAMKAKLGRLREQEEIDDDGNVKAPILTNLEQLQYQLHQVAVNRAPLLEVLVEAMEVSPKYSDVYEVCSKSNFDDIFEMAATTIARNEGRDFNEVLVQLELEVWKKPNPYKYMYTIIKTNHPKYKGKDEVKEAEKEKEKEKPSAAKVLEAKKAPGSIAALGPGDNASSGVWTAAKIDDLDESELRQVPKEIYQKYMMGKLK
jgi:hypothetical protein